MLRLTILLLACALVHAADPLPAGNRRLGIDVGTTGNGDYDAAVALAVSCGMQDIGLSLDWKDVETTPGTYNGTAFWWASAYNTKFPTSSGITISLTLRPIHNGAKPVPADLAGTDFDNATMIQRFKDLITWVFGQLPNATISNLSIGSESDVWLEQDTTRWTKFQTFYQAVATHAKSLRPGLPVAAELTWGGLTGTAQTRALALNSVSDWIGVSYYGIGAGYAVKSQATVTTDLNTLLSYYTTNLPTKPLCFYQFGYPSATLLGSSESAQAAFVQTAFTWWDTNATRVRVIDFTWLNDASPQFVTDSAAYFGDSSPAFAAFIGSLGLRTYAGAGTDKAAYTALHHQARARGWGNRIPNANAQSVTTNISTALPITLSATDADGDPLTFSVASTPTHGTLSGSAPALTYTPTAGYSGSDSFTFKALDADALSAPATVTIGVGVTVGGSGGTGGGSSGGGGCGIGSGIAALLFALGLCVVRLRP